MTLKQVVNSVLDQLESNNPKEVLNGISMVSRHIAGTCRSIESSPGNSNNETLIEGAIADFGLMLEALKRYRVIHQGNIPAVELEDTSIWGSYGLDGECPNCGSRGTYGLGFADYVYPTQIRRSELDRSEVLAAYTNPSNWRCHSCSEEH